MPVVPFGEWLPDLPDYENQGATVARNVIPDYNSYLPFPAQAVYTTSISGVCKGTVVARDLIGNYYNYVGDASALYVMVGQSWSSVTRTAGGAYTTAADDFWEFTQFGSQLIAVNGHTDAPQAISLGATAFAALSGSPPKARHIASIRDFVVMGNLSATATSPQMVRWCAINNAGSWTPDAATMADFQDLPGDHGWVQKIVGGEYGTVFMERAIYRMTFVGSPLVFQFDKVISNLGAYAPNSVAAHRNIAFFLSEEGFCMFDGSNVKPIGEGKVDRTFFSDLDTEYTYRISSAIDPIRKIVAWAYPGAGNTGGNPNNILIYHYGCARWSRIEGLNIEWIMRAITGGYTLDGLDAYSTNIDTILLTLDSIQWTGGNYLFSCFDSGHRLNQFNGSAMQAVVETNEVNFNQNGLAYITELRPIGQGLSASYQCAVGSRLNLTQSISFSTAVSPISAGYCEVRNTNRYHRFRLQTTSATDFEHLQGIDVKVSGAGER